MTNVTALNIKFTNKDADNNTIWAASSFWHTLSTTEIADRLDVDYDCAKCIKPYLTDEAAIAEGVNVEFWFN